MKEKKATGIVERMARRWNNGEQSELYFAADAPTPKGQERVMHILNTAKSILIRDGVSSLTLRQVAREAKIALSNLQYYYATFEDLIKGLMLYVMHTYDVRYTAMFADPQIDSARKMKQVYQYLIEDTKNPETNALFFGIWEMAQHSPDVALAMDFMYTYQREWVEGMISKVCPAMPEQLVKLRAALITTQIEGLMLLLGKGKPEHETLKGLEEECSRQLMQLSGVEFTFTKPSYLE